MSNPEVPVPKKKKRKKNSVKEPFRCSLLSFVCLICCHFHLSLLVAYIYQHRPVRSQLMLLATKKLAFVNTVRHSHTHTLKQTHTNTHPKLRLEKVLYLCQL